MLCGASAHDRPIPIGAEEKNCALNHLEKHYTFVATTERCVFLIFNESPLTSHHVVALSQFILGSQYPCHFSPPCRMSTHN